MYPTHTYIDICRSFLLPKRKLVFFVYVLELIANALVHPTLSVSFLQCNTNLLRFWRMPYYASCMRLIQKFSVIRMFSGNNLIYLNLTLIHVIE